MYDFDDFCDVCFESNFLHRIFQQRICLYYSYDEQIQFTRTYRNTSSDVQAQCVDEEFKSAVANVSLCMWLTNVIVIDFCDEKIEKKIKLKPNQKQR